MSLYNWGEPHTNHYYEKKCTTYVCMYVCIRDTSNTCFAHVCMRAPPELNQMHVYIYGWSAVPACGTA